jgi:adenosylhomocysteine nucleosidase
VTILVPRGAEAAAVRRARPAARIVELAAGSAAADALPDSFAGDAIVLGLCGALRDLRAGDVAVYHSVGDGTQRIALDAVLAAALTARVPGAVLSDAYTADHVVTSVRERAELATRYAAGVVDMEGAALAVALAARGVRFAMVRVVSDDATRDLPALGAAIRPDGTLDAVRVALAFIRRPRAAVAFVRDARRALRRLTTVARSLPQRFSDL